MGRCVIIGGAEIKNYEFIKKYLREDDYFIFCDKGLAHVDPLGLRPSLIICEVDSHENPGADVETITLPIAKDDTDTVYAVKEGIRRGFTEFILIGAVGQRMDHTLANVYMLEMLYNQGLKGLIIDDYGTMELIGAETVKVEDDVLFFSLLNITGETSGITITGAKFPLEDAEIKTEYQYGVSNEVLPGCTAEVSVKRGCALLMRVYNDSGKFNS
ncbi:MAG: thiamine diphosphokinase [Parasporobacterium sp.]|nr:thiamine diphosphokinase [Parasporobacterium sp.]